MGLKYTTTLGEWFLIVLAIVISFYLFIWTGRKLAVGTAYAVFVGLGTVGTVVDSLLFLEPINLPTVLFIFILLVGVIGLKMTSIKNRREGGTIGWSGFLLSLQVCLKWQVCHDQSI